MVRKDNTKQYYYGLAKQYLLLARRYVRKYDELTKSVVEAVLTTNPKRILDIGQGVSNIELMIFKSNPSVHIECLDTEKEMILASRETLKDYLKMVKFHNLDVRRYHPQKLYDVVFTNMTIHNIPYADKEKVLSSIYKWLKKEGVFVSGDFITFEDPGKVKAAFDARKQFAIGNGENPKSKFFIESFYKEENLDYPSTPEQIISLMGNVGFRNIEQTWGYDNFGLFVAKK